MKKYGVVVMLCITTSMQSSFTSGLGKIWEGTKEVAHGTWETVTSPFRGGSSSKKESVEKKEAGKKNQAKPQPKQEKKVTKSEAVKKIDNKKAQPKKK